ncbi:MAG: hypothetical protein V7K54_01420 [Nostoc sp.]
MLYENPDQTLKVDIPIFFYFELHRFYFEVQDVWKQFVLLLVLQTQPNKKESAIATAPCSRRPSGGNCR